MFFEAIQALDFTGPELTQACDKLLDQHFRGGRAGRHPNPEAPPNALRIEFVCAAN
jgi:hypothetical protein